VIPEDLIVHVTQEMLDEAKRLSPKCDIKRTKASPLDTLSGILGEFAWAQLRYGDWRKNNVGRNKGRVDFKGGVECKASVHPYSDKLNLLVRCEYAQAREAKYYVQFIIDCQGNILPGTKMVPCGFALHDEVVRAPLRDFGKKGGGDAGYLCHFIPIIKLRPIERLLNIFKIKRAKEQLKLW